MGTRSAAPIAAVARILVAIEPQMYREVLAFHIRQQRPRCAEVVLASPQTLLAETERVSPHLIVASEGFPPQLKERGIFWVEVHADDRLDATISANGYSTTIHDVSLQDLLVLVDKTVEEFGHEA